MPDGAHLSLGDLAHLVLDQAASYGLEYGGGGLRLADFDALPADTPHHILGVRIDTDDARHIVLARPGDKLQGDDLMPTLCGIRGLLQVCVRETLLCRAEGSDRGLPVLQHRGSSLYIGRGVLAWPWDLVTREEQVFPQGLEGRSGHLS